MCLSTITRSVTGEEGNKIRKGYKRYFGVIKKKGLIPLFKFADLTVPIGEWIDEKDFRLTDCEEIIQAVDASYPMGFHVYKSKKATVNESLWCSREKRRKVKFTELHTIGKEICSDGEYRTVYVARKIYVTPTLGERIRKLFTGCYI